MAKPSATPADEPVKPAKPANSTNAAKPVKAAKKPTEDTSADTSAPTFSESLSRAAKSSGFGQLQPGETPSAKALLGAIGGIRGVFESVLPGIAFLVLYLTTHNLLDSVLVPALLALIFAVARAGARSSLTSAIAGAVLLAISAVLVLITGRAVTNFVPGILINAVGLVVMLVSILVRWPLIGAVVGLLFGDVDGWRQDPPKRRILTIATWLWVGLFVVRLALEVPLYLADNVAALGVVRLITSVPLYALVLWATWLLVRGVYAGDRPAAEDDSDDDVAPDEADKTF
jgi:hypothetical protein